MTHLITTYHVRVDQPLQLGKWSFTLKISAQGGVRLLQRDDNETMTIGFRRSGRFFCANDSA